jgi:tetratricopeptide (TPR) repeat protein
MVFVVDDLVSWLVGLLAETGRKRLVILIRGSDQQRALREAAKAAVQLTAAELCPEGGHRAEDAEREISQAFVKRGPGVVLAGDGTLLENLQQGIWIQVAQLSDAGLGIPVALLAERLTGRLIREIVVRGAGGGPLAPLADQLNHDVAHLRGQRIEGMLANVMDAVTAVADMIAAPRVLSMTAARTLPADTLAFTGREAELGQLLAAAADPADTPGVIAIIAIGGMGGVGKTAFAVHAAHLLAPRFPDGQLFVSLHAHTPGQQPADPEAALAGLLLATGTAPQAIPAGLAEREAMWRDRMASRRVLLILDDAADSSQVRPLLPAATGTVVLVTSRRRLTDLPQATPIALEVLKPAEAGQLFIRLANHPGARTDDETLARIAGRCGYLPLAVSLAAGQFKHHPAWTLSDLARYLEPADDDLPAGFPSVAASASLSYDNLPENQQQLFRRLSLHPGTDIDAYAAAALNDTDLKTTRRLLEELYSYHLIDEPASGRYRFHDLIASYARALSADSPPAERDFALTRLLDYYLHTTRAAMRYLNRRAPTTEPGEPAKAPAASPSLFSRDLAAAWMDAERINLHAAASYAAASRHPGHTIALSSAMHGYLRTQGPWDQGVSLHTAAVTAARQASDSLAQARALNDLGVMQRLTGNYPAAAASLNQALDLCRVHGDQRGEARALNDVGILQQSMGDYAAALASQVQAQTLCRDLGDRHGEATATNYLGIAQCLTGDHLAAAASHDRALLLYRDCGDRIGEANTLTCLGIVQQQTGDYTAAAASHARALEMHSDLGNTLGMANALNYVGAAQHLAGDHAAAAASQAQSLALYRRLGDRLGEAEVLNSMGELSLASGIPASARRHHQQALAIATDIGSTRQQARATEGINRSQPPHYGEGEAAQAHTPGPGDLPANRFPLLIQQQPPRMRRRPE